MTALGYSSLQHFLLSVCGRRLVAPGRVLMIASKVLLTLHACGTSVSVVLQPRGGFQWGGGSFCESFDARHVDVAVLRSKDHESCHVGVGLSLCVGVDLSILHVIVDGGTWQARGTRASLTGALLPDERERVDPDPEVCGVPAGPFVLFGFLAARAGCGVARVKQHTSIFNASRVSAVDRRSLLFRTSD